MSRAHRERRAFPAGRHGPRHPRGALGGCRHVGLSTGPVRAPLQDPSDTMRAGSLTLSISSPRPAAVTLRAPQATQSPSFGDAARIAATTCARTRPDFCPLHRARPRRWTFPNRRWPASRRRGWSSRIQAAPRRASASLPGRVPCDRQAAVAPRAAAAIAERGASSRATESPSQRALWDIPKAGRRRRGRSFSPRDRSVRDRRRRATSSSREGHYRAVSAGAGVCSSERRRRNSSPAPAAASTAEMRNVGS